MIRCKFKDQLPISYLLIIFIQLIYLTIASEFPERECCDPIYPLLPNPEPSPSATASTTNPSISSSPTTTFGHSGSNNRSAIAILNCILARQLCFEDPSCSAILEIIPRVCGPVPVACSTVTVTKCQAALKTLQAFPFFRPTCLCKEPGVDPDCNNFQDFLFDHPCSRVLKKEKDPYPVDALPTCNHALSVCQHERKCIKLFENFKTHCKVRDNKCRMEDRDLCHEAWTNLRLSPMFGCICPNNHMKRRCDRIFSMVNHNPCVDVLPIPAHDVLDTSNIQSSTLSQLHSQKIQNNFTNEIVIISDRSNDPISNLIHIPPIIIPIPLTQASRNPNKYPNANNHPPESFHTNPNIHLKNMGTSTTNNKHDTMNNIMHSHRSSNSGYDIMQHHHHLSTREHNDKKFPSTQRKPYHSSMEIVQSMSVADTYHHQHLFDENMVQIEMPLIAPVSMHYPHHRHNVYYPYNLTGFQSGPSADNIISEAGGSMEKHQSLPDISPDPHSEIIRIHFQSTCHTALDACREDPSCATSVEPVLMHCDLHRCNRNACMDALQSFYRASHEDLSLDVAFCLCKKTSNRHDVCMIAQEKLHPVCAQRPPDIINSQTSNGAMYHPPPACHIVADLCKEDLECRSRLEYYEQACAVDSVTKKCAGRASSCRSAMLGILGTPLRTSCACQGTEVQQLYGCMGWHRLLWLNPCVVESQKDFHMKRLAELGLLITTTTSTSTTTTTTTSTPMPTKPVFIEIPRPTKYTKISITTETALDNNIEPPSDSMPETLLYNGSGNINENGGNGGSGEQHLVSVTSVTTVEIENVETTSTTTATTTTTTMASTVPPRFCIVQRPQQSDQQIPESSTRRIYSLDDAECSELCSCGDTLTLTCHALCVPFNPCRTALAFYSHASPAYQAFRGRCLCYSGKFICMRPPPNEYSLPGGVFLMLGYSSTDEALLRPYTNLGVQDAIRGLQHYVNKHIENQTSCTLTLFNMTDENIIISARLPHDSKINPMELLRKEKAQCTSILEKISHQVNSQHSELAAHRLLSIFKMAEVQIVWPEVNGCRKEKSFPILSVLVFIVFPTIRLLCHTEFIHRTTTVKIIK